MPGTKISQRRVLFFEYGAPEAYIWNGAEHRLCRQEYITRLSGDVRAHNKPFTWNSAEER